MPTRTDSLIERFKVNEKNDVFKYEIIFTTVNDLKLAYCTNKKGFIENLEKFKGKRFVLEYEKAEFKTGMKNRILKAKLPKIK